MRCVVQWSARSVSEPRKTCVADALSLCGSWASCINNMYIHSLGLYVNRRSYCCTQYDRLLARYCMSSVRPSVCLSLCTVTLCIVALRVGILGAESCTVVFLAGIFLFPSWDTFDVECSTAVFFTVGTDVVQPLLLWSSFGRWPCVCPCRSRCAWIVVTSHAGHMIEICQSTCRSAGLEQCPFGSPPLSICPDFVYGLSWLHSRSFSTLTSQELLTLSFVFPWVSKFLSYKVHCVSEKNAQTLKRYSSKL